MRVLFVSAPLLGHVFPLVPLAKALRAAGHEVHVVTGGDGLAVSRAGLPVDDMDLGVGIGRIAIGVMLRHPLIARAEMAGTAGTRGVSLLFGELNARMRGPVAGFVAARRPDLIVYEPLAVAGAVAAAEFGIPAVLHENSLFDGPTLVEVTARTPVAPPAATISIAPPSVLPDRPGWPMRAVPYSGEGPLPDWLAAPPASGTPRIAVSRSTVAGPGGDRLMSTVVDAAAGLDVEVVLIRPDKRVARRSLPENVRTVDWVPVPDVLVNCAGVVHHGGAGTTLAALGAGVPQIVVNGPGDRRHNATLIACRGAGLALDERAISAEALTRLVADAALASAAAEVRAEMAAMPSPGTLVPRLEALLR